MRCLVNLTHLDPPSNGGVSRTAREVSMALAAHARERTLEVVFAVGWRFAPQFRDWIGDPQAAVLPCLSGVEVSPLCRIQRPDMIVSPLFGGDPFDVSEEFKTLPHIVSMPDALALERPELFDPAEARRRRRIYTSLRHATLVVTRSEHSRRQLIYHLNLPPGRVVIVPLGAELAEAPSISAPPVPPPYVFYPANDWPHKRHDLLLQVMREIWKARPEIKLVLTGGRHGVVLNELLQRHERPEGRVVNLGFVSDAEVAALYRHAEALLFVSEYEGFGMPLVEAMTNGCPVICAPLTAIPETAGDAALFVNSDDPRDWAGAFLNTLPAMRSELVGCGRRHAQKFTWKKSRDAWMTHLFSCGLRLTPADEASRRIELPLDAITAELLEWCRLAHEKERNARDLQCAADESREQAALDRESADRHAQTSRERLKKIENLKATLDDWQGSRLVRFVKRTLESLRKRTNFLSHWFRRKDAGPIE